MKFPNTAALARYLNAVGQGISIQAASGVSRAELRQVAAMALRQLPKAEALRGKCRAAKNKTPSALRK